MQKFLTTQEVAARLGISAPTVLALARDGELSYMQFGKRTIRFRSESVEEYIAAHTYDGNGRQAPAAEELIGR